MLGAFSSCCAVKGVFSREHFFGPEICLGLIVSNTPLKTEDGMPVALY